MLSYITSMSLWRLPEMTYHLKNVIDDLIIDNNERKALYCEFYAIDQRELEEDKVVAEYVENHHQILDALIAGYKEMGPLNKKICDELVGCECETEFEKKR